MNATPRTEDCPGAASVMPWSWPRALLLQSVPGPPDDDDDEDEDDDERSGGGDGNIEPDDDEGCDGEDDEDEDDEEPWQVRAVLTAAPRCCLLG